MIPDFHLCGVDLILLFCYLFILVKQIKKTFLSGLYPRHYKNNCTIISALSVIFLAPQPHPSPDLLDSFVSVNVHKCHVVILFVRVF